MQYAKISLHSTGNEYAVIYGGVKMQLERLRVYASVNNLCTFTGYSGIDPEFSRKSVLDTGVDNYIFPFTRSYLFGVQLSF